jgi:hypothetical protein
MSRTMSIDEFERALEAKLEEVRRSGLVCASLFRE